LSGAGVDNYSEQLIIIANSAAFYGPQILILVKFSIRILLLIKTDRGLKKFYKAPDLV
jgi:hypothetical protein